MRRRLIEPDAFSLWAEWETTDGNPIADATWTVSTEALVDWGNGNWEKYTATGGLDTLETTQSPEGPKYRTRWYFADLTDLTTFDGSVNSFEGRLPHYDQAPNLTILDLEDNDLSGELRSFDNSAALVLIDLSRNSLTGSIPDLSALTAATSISLSFNELSGSIPNLATLTSLEYFQTYNNSLTGSIPSLAANTALVQFMCYNNSLTGSIPSLAANTLLDNFRCQGNSLTGSIPDLSANTALQYFYCGDNSLTGSIPDLSANTALLVFSCESNSLTGSIPSLSTNTSLTRFYCSDNSLSGDIPDLSNNIGLQVFDCSNNNITGYTASTLAATITSFDASGNALSESDVDQILADFVTGLAGRPGAGTIDLSGGTNAAPSDAGMDNLVLIVAHGWDVITNFDPAGLFVGNTGTFYDFTDSSAMTLATQPTPNDWDMEAAGVGAWPNWGTPNSVTKETVDPSPAGGQYLRIYGGHAEGVVQLGGATTGNRFKASCYAKGAGNATIGMLAAINPNGNAIKSTRANTWQFIEGDTTAVGPRLLLQCNDASVIMDDVCCFDEVGCENLSVVRVDPASSAGALVGDYLANATAVDQPWWDESAGGLHLVDDGNEDALISANPTSWKSLTYNAATTDNRPLCTFAFVVNLDTVAGNNQLFWFSDGLLSPWGVFSVVVAGVVHLYFHNGSGFVLSCNTGAFTLAAGSWYVIIYRSDAVNGEIWVNGTRRGQAAYSAGAIPEPTLDQSYHLSRSGINSLDGVVKCEFAVDTALSDDELHRLGAHLASKYGGSWV